MVEGEKSKSKRRENRIGQNTVERAGTCYAARNTGAEKSKQNTQGRSCFFRRRPEEVSTQGLFSYILGNAKEKMWSLRCAVPLPAVCDGTSWPYFDGIFFYSYERRYSKIDG